MTNTVRDQVERVMASYRPTPLSQHDVDNARGPLPRYIHPTPLEWGEVGEPIPHIDWTEVAIAAVTVGLLCGVWLGVAWLVFRRLSDG